MTATTTHKSVMFGPFRSSTTSVVGMLLCIFATILAMVSISTDQTGTSVATVAQSFSESFHSQPIDGLVSTPSKARSRIFQFASANNRVSPEPEFPERKFQDEEELFAFDADLLEDTNEAGQTRIPRRVEVTGFPHFVQELGRLRDMSRVHTCDSQPFVDFIAAEEMSSEACADTIGSLIESTIDQTRATSLSPSLTFRAILWSPSPTFAMLTKTAREAGAIEQLVREQLSQQGIKNVTVAIESSTWMSTIAQRPVFSVRIEMESLVTSQ